MSDSEITPKTTPLHALHLELKAKMVPFAGYEMPIQFPMGILKEHLHTRAQAGLFDVSHMGQIRICGDQAAEALESVVVGDIQGLKAGRTRYTLFTNDVGGILDDLMVTRVAGDELLLVVNASRKLADFALLSGTIGGRAVVEYLESQALLALQGPQAGAVLARFAPVAASMRFMDWVRSDIQGIPVTISRSGYTGEDGFEISVPGDQAEALARLFIAVPDVAPIGLGARDTLRLEAGLCLYGQDIDEKTTPVEAGLAWTIGKRRRAEANFPGAAQIMRQLADGPALKRVGLRPQGKAPAREHTEITAEDGQRIGEVTSGGFGPSVGGPIAMGAVAADHAVPGATLDLVIRGKPQPATIVDLPFVPHRYVKG